MNAIAPRTGFALIALLALAGCANHGLATRTMGNSAADCRAARAEAALGQKADPHVIEQALAASGGARTRVIGPKSPLSTASDPMRLNIEVDAEGRIRRMVCG